MNHVPTARQQLLLNHFKDWVRSHACAPTHSELAKVCGYRSTNAVRSHIRLLEKKGLILREPGKARTMRLANSSANKHRRKSDPSPSGIPLVGDIPAGPLAEALEHPSDTLAIAPGTFRGADLFALRVKGDSMRDAGILSGDLAILSRQDDVESGAIAAIVINGEATLKRLLRKDRTLVLRAANPACPDIVVEPSASQPVRIAGRLVGIVRTEVRW